MQLWPERRFHIAHGFESGLFVRRLTGGDGTKEGSRGTVFYVHGLGESALCFERLMADTRLAAWNHVAPDLAGYGKSPWCRQPLTLAEHAERLAELLEASSGSVRDPVVLVGHSMGGVIGILLAELAPQKVRAFVNVEGNVSLPDCAYSGRAAKHPLETWLDHGYGDLLDSLYEDQREDPAVLRPYCASIQMCDPRAFHRNSEELVTLSTAETLAARMAALGLSRIYFFGAPRGAGDPSRTLLAEAGIEMVGIPDAGHWPFLDQPDGFVTELRGFLEGLEAVPEGGRGDAPKVAGD